LNVEDRHFIVKIIGNETEIFDIFDRL
jgi:hypothetical protein